LTGNELEFFAGTAGKHSVSSFGPSGSGAVFSPLWLSATLNVKCLGCHVTCSKSFSLCCCCLSVHRVPNAEVRWSLMHVHLNRISMVVAVCSMLWTLLAMADLTRSKRLESPFVPDALASYRVGNDENKPLKGRITYTVTHIWRFAGFS